ncbi:MAG TPA: hypothetical protein PLN54_03955 [Flavobacteriales bacterium]|nr:hypothetical protein [Flavobacteriales bacterium]
MRNLLLPAFALVLCSSTARAQPSTRFAPHWQVGDKRTATTTRHEVDMKYGEVEEDTTFSIDTHYKVLSEDADSYLLEMRYANVAMRMAAEFHDRIDEELKAYQDLVLEYRVDKVTGEADLTNWKEAKAFMDKGIKAITTTVKKKDPDLAPLLSLVLAPIQAAFESKENIEAYMSTEINYLLFPFGKDFVQGDTLRMVETAPNPFNPRDSVSQTTLTWLHDPDGSGGRSDIHSTVLLDLSGFKAMMTDMMRKMGSSFGAADSTLQRQEREIAELDFEVTNSMVIVLEEATGWPLSVVQRVLITGSDPKGRRERSVTATVQVR